MFAIDPIRALLGSGIALDIGIEAGLERMLALSAPPLETPRVRFGTIKAR